MSKLPVLVFALVASTLAPSCSDDPSKGEPDGGASGGRASSGGAGGSRSDSDGAAAGGAGGASGEDGSAGRGTGGKGSGSGGRASGGNSSVDGGPIPGALPASTFLYVKAETPDHDILMALDLASGEERVVTDLTGDGSDGSEIWGASISPDRTRIAIASLYGPTREDVVTGLATRRIWSLAADGSDFRRLTPVFENTGAGRRAFTIEVDRPAFTRDGNAVIYNFGNYWYENTTLQGGSLPWWVPAEGGALPSPFTTVSNCSVLHPSVNPATGDVLFIHSVCIDRAAQGLVLYPEGGGTEPTMLVQSGFGAGQVDVSLTPPSWVSDGSGFVFVGVTSVERNGTTDTARSLFVYDMAESQVLSLVVPEPDEYVQAAAITPDASAIVYCLRHGNGADDLRLIDLTTEPATDAPLTTDGKSCYPTF